MSVLSEQHLADRRVTEWFRREKAQREGAKTQPMPIAPPVITLSRQFSGGGHSVAEALLERLGEPWEIWGKELIEAVATSAKVRAEMVEALDERAQSWMDEMIYRVFGRDVLEPATYRKHLMQVVLALAHHGHKIIVGRGANFILPDALNVRLQASEAYRLKTAMERENLSEEDARRKMNRIDRARAEFTSSIFDRHIDDPAAYDMVLRTDTLGREPSAAAIAAAARVMFDLPPKA